MIVALNEFLTHEPAEEYHARSSNFLSSHALKDFRKSPLLYHRKKTGVIPDDNRPEFNLGRAAHTLILEGREELHRQYAIVSPDNPQTGDERSNRLRMFDDSAEAQVKAVLPEEDLAVLEGMNEGVQLHEIAVELLSIGEPEGVIRAEYAGMPCQIRLDWFNPRVGIIELKTCDDLTWFENDARRYGYIHQLAFYRSVLNQVAPRDLSVFLIAVEKKQPFRCGVWRVGDDALGAARRENELAIARLKHCIATGTWPTGFEGVRNFDTL